MQVDPIKPMLTPLGIQHLKPKCDILLSTFAFKCNLRRYIEEKAAAAEGNTEDKAEEVGTTTYSSPLPPTRF